MDQGRRLIRPGEEPQEIEELLASFFAALDSRFPGKCIIWEEWDHERLDETASYLCSYLGYSRGAHFLTAYGYTLVTRESLAEPVQNSQASLDGKTADAEPELPEKQEVKDAVAEKQETLDAAATREQEAHTGRIVSVLPNGNSGFVRDDADGRDYYFNVRSFRCWVDALTPGLAVQFHLAQRIDRRRGVLRPNAVDLRFIS